MMHPGHSRTIVTHLGQDQEVLGPEVLPTGCKAGHGAGQMEDKAGSGWVRILVPSVRDQADQDLSFICLGSGSVEEGECRNLSLSTVPRPTPTALKIVTPVPEVELNIAASSLAPSDGTFSPLQICLMPFIFLCPSHLLSPIHPSSPQKHSKEAGSEAFPSGDNWSVISSDFLAVYPLCSPRCSKPGGV